MAKIVTKKRKIRYEGVIILLFIFSVTVNLFSALFINSINNNLTIQVQKKEASIKALISENETISVNIKELVNKDRVFAVAENNDMSIEQSNVIAIN